MQVLLVNESHGKSLVRTRRILSSVLAQLGERTWCGHIDAQGLEGLRLALKAAASKTTSVACHRLGRDAHELLWTVGRAADFDEQGRLCFRVRKLSAPAPVKAGHGWRLLRNLTRLAALFHDLGKANQLFARKLRNPDGPQSEPLRHELLSYLIVLDALEGFAGSSASPQSQDLAWLDALAANPRVIAGRMSATSLLGESATKRALALMKEGTDASLFPAALQKLLAHRPLLATVAWLVLTHHKLPGTRDKADLSRHTHPRRAALRDDALLNLAPAHGVLPWDDGRWTASVAAVAGRLAALLREDTGLANDAPSLVLLGAHMARPALILGDYMASAMKREAHDLDDTAVLANTRDASTGGDCLATHLLSAREHSDVLFRLRHQASTSFAPTRLQSGPVLELATDARFAWQQESSEAVGKALAEHPGAGLFAVVASRTGSGKTQGGLRLLNAACGGELRFSLALSRRSLTLQAGEDYRRDAGLTGKQMAVAVGSAVSVALAEAGARGSDGVEASEDDLDVHWEGEPGGWEAELQGADEAVLRSRKLRQLISAPVLVTTVDHLVGGVELLRGRQSLLSLRLMSADLVLDEIDNYSALDLVSLGKLVMVAAMHRRKVVLMSATVAQPVVHALHEAYLRGLELADRIDGRGQSCVSATVCDALPARIALDASTKQYLAGYEAYIEQYLQVLEAAPVRHRMSVLSTEGCKSLAEVVDVVMAGAGQLHSDNHVVDAATGVRLSVGFVRWSTARNCMAAVRLAAERAKSLDSAGSHVKLVSYHAKLPLLALHYLDRTLGRVLKRRPGESLTEHPELRRLLDEAKAQGRSDVTVVVMSTSLLETGRDHDYDWCVLEPRSPRAETQAMGRVRRHRSEEWDAVNVLLLSHPTRLLAKRPHPTWGMPGIERNKSPFRVHKNLWPALRQLAQAVGVGSSLCEPVDTSRAEAALPVAQWLSRFSARPCLQVPRDYTSNRIGSLEQLELHAVLVDGCGLDTPTMAPIGLAPQDAPLPAALLHYVSGHAARGRLPHAWSAAHGLRTQFRKGELDGRYDHALFIDATGEMQRWRVACSNSNASVAVVGIVFEEEVDPTCFWLDVALGMAAIAKELQDHLRRRGNHQPAQAPLGREALTCMVASHEVSPTELKGSYHPLIGLDVR